MIIAKLMGGMGNQMFEYAMARHLAYKHNTELKLDISSYKTDPLREYELQHFKITASLATISDMKQITSRFLRFLKRNNIKVFKEKIFHFDSSALSLPDNTYLQGYWQSEKYFKDIEDIIRKEFRIKKMLPSKFKSLQSHINATNSISLHVRHSDYLTNPERKKIHGILPITYYKKAIDTIKNKVNNPIFYIFSDDMTWVKTNIKFTNQVIYVDRDESQNWIADFNLMSLCKHHIIANSTFSWWAAWLCENKNKIVIAPKKWFRSKTFDTSDLIPNQWIRL
jgi:hypothetical protein